MGGADAGVRLLVPAWRQAAADGGFDPDTAHPDRLEIGFSAAGDLLHFLVVARTDDGKRVTLGWSGFGGAPDQNVMITGTVEGDASSGPEPTPDRVSSILLAIDTIGAENMVAALPSVGADGYYLVTPLLGIGTLGGTISSQATAYIWDGSVLAALPADDPRRGYDPASVHLKVIADAGGQSLQTGTTSSVLPTAYFVITGPMLSTTTTAPLKIGLLSWLRLDVNPRLGVRVAVGGLTQEPGELVVRGEIIIDNQSQTPFLYQAGDFQLYLEDAVLVPTVSAPMLASGEVQPGAMLHGYLLTWGIPFPTADHIGLAYNSSDPESDGFNQMVSIMP